MSNHSGRSLIDCGVASSFVPSFFPLGLPLPSALLIFFFCAANGKEHIGSKNKHDMFRWIGESMADVTTTVVHLNAVMIIECTSYQLFINQGKNLITYGHQVPMDIDENPRSIGQRVS